MIGYYQIRSPLSQITEGHMTGYIRSLSEKLREDMEQLSLEEYLSSDFALLYVASGGSEGYFLEIFDQLKDRHCYILTSGESNSLAASMEILSFLRKHRGSGEILHGDLDDLAEKIAALAKAHRAKDALRGKRIACIGDPSDWLIASNYSSEAMMKKLNLEYVQISMDELLDEIKKNQYAENQYTFAFKNKDFDRGEIEKALFVYGAFKRLCERYQLIGVSVRCFDLLDTVRTTGCLGLSILNDEGIYGGCEGDVPTLLSMAVMGALTGEPMFICNASRFDTKAGSAVFAHCTIPTKMLESFSLNTHFESGIGVAVQGTVENGDCTVFKCEGDLSRYHAQEGVIVGGTFSHMLCRTQVKVKLDDFGYFLTEPINNHHVICRGRHKAKAKAFFQLLDD